MKVRYLMLPIMIISVMILVIKEETKIENKTIFNENTEISYPFFGNNKIDKYISNYLNKNIKEDKVFIDYDYGNKDEIYYLTFYKYIINDNKINSDIDNLVINTSKNNINKTSMINYEYDIIENKVIDKEQKLIALTFDDGPSYNTNKVIDVLEKYNAKATFFVLGSKIKGNEYILKRLEETGNEIGNHTYNHLLLTKYEEEKIEEEINKTSNLIFEVTGKYPTLLRTSYGSVNNKIKKLANMPIIIWDIDTLDWKYHNSKKIAGRVITKAKDGDIVLMHDIYSATANALNTIIPTLQERGYNFVTVSELFYYKGINLEKGKVYCCA